MKKRIFPILAACCLFLPSVGGIVAEANSAPAYWEGTGVAGVVSATENCPVTVEKELLTLDIQAFPFGEHADGIASFTADYTFYNPTEQEIQMRLYFPFGKLPDYVSVGELNGAGYQVLSDGGELSYSLRYTYHPYRDLFALEEQLNALQDDYRADGFFRPDTPVTFCNYDVSKGEEYVCLLDYNRQKTRVIFDTGFRYCDVENGYTKVNVAGFGIAGEEERTVSCYILGELPDELPVLYRVEDGALTEDAVYAEEKRHTTTLLEYALLGKPTELAVSDVDFFNAYVEKVTLEQRSDRCAFYFNGLDITELMGWYDYSLTIPPLGRVQNTVKGPLYPSIYGSTPVYEYEYYLSPASRWADFGEFELVINTPFYVQDCSLNGFVQTENEYRLKRDNLPHGELNLTLSQSASAGYGDYGDEPFYSLPIILACTVGGLIPLAVGAFLLVGLVRKRRKQKEDARALADGQTENSAENFSDGENRG